MGTEVFLILFLTSRLLRPVWNDEYTRQTQSDCYNTELSCNETTVSFFNVITNRARRNAKYFHFFVTIILVENG